MELHDEVVRSALAESEVEDPERPLQRQLRLCFIEERTPFAWFTTAPRHMVGGKDWDRRPCSEYAEPPGPIPGYELVRIVVTFADDVDGDAFIVPHASAQEIRNKEAPWLRSEDGSKQLFAGATLEEFMRFVEANGGQIFLPRGLERRLA